jgi:hypothetical protein
MKVSDIKVMLDRIHEAAFDIDPGKAQEIEYHLFQVVLEAIAEGSDDPMILAEYALRATTIDFPRRY